MEEIEVQRVPNCDYLFIPVAVEISGVFGLDTRSFLKELGHHVARVSGDKCLYFSNSVHLSHCSKGPCSFYISWDQSQRMTCPFYNLL